jgi:hypothetical protein
MNPAEDNYFKYFEHINQVLNYIGEYDPYSAAEQLREAKKLVNTNDDQRRDQIKSLEDSVFSLATNTLAENVHLLLMDGHPFQAIRHIKAFDVVALYMDWLGREEYTFTRTLLDLSIKTFRQSLDLPSIEWQNPYVINDKNERRKNKSIYFYN